MFAPRVIDGSGRTVALAKKQWRVVVECLAVAALVVIAFRYGRFAFLNTAAPPDYYWMAPAVSVAAGEGLQWPVAAKGSALDDFLASRRPALDVHDATPLQVAPLPGAEYAAMRYLLTTVGYWWRIAGIRWSALADVAAALHVLAVVGVYATLRLFTPLLVSLAGALWVAASTIQLSFVPHVRDYSKGGFILAAVPLILFATLRARSRIAIVASSAAAGGLIGFGLGFRMDLAIMVPIAIAVIVLFRGHRPWADLADKALAVATLMCALILTSYPVVSRLGGGGSNSMHVILLGYADQFDGGLGIVRPAYRLLPEYDDGYIDSVVVARSESTLGRWPRLPVSVEYDRVGSQLWTELLLHFPADAFVRVLGATNTVLNLVFVNPDPDLLFKRALPAAGILKTAYAWLHSWNGWGAALGTMLVIVASLSSIRLALLAVFLLFALGGYPSLQFGPRHYFHLQAVPVLAVLVLGWTAATAPFRIERIRPRGAFVNMGIAVGVLIMSTVVPLGILRAHQSRHVERMLSRFLASSSVRLDVESVQTPDGKWLVRWPQAAGKPSKIGPFAWAYYLVEFDAAGSPVPPAIGLRYRLSPTHTSCLRALSAAPGPGVVRFGFEVFSSTGREFEGIEVEDRARQRLVAVYRMSEDGPAGLPMELRLPSDWQRRPLYQRLQLVGQEDLSGELKAAAPFSRCE